MSTDCAPKPLGADLGVGRYLYFQMMDIGVRTTEYRPYETPHPWGDRPSDDLPLSAAVWDAAKHPNRTDSTIVIQTLYEAVKQLETQLVERDHN